MLLFKRSIYPLILPLMILVLSAVLIWQWDKILPMVRNPRHLQALLVILPMLPSIIFFVGFIMGWRYNNAALMLASLVLALSYMAITMLSGNNPSAENMNLSVTRGIAFLLPLNLASFTLMTKRRIFTMVGIIYGLSIRIRILWYVSISCRSRSCFGEAYAMAHPGSRRIITG